MNIYLPRLQVHPWVDIPVDEFEVAAARDRFGVHRLTGDADASDVILFPHCHMLPTDWRLSTIREHPLTRGNRDKVLVYDERDRPWCAFPGVYVSMPSRGFDYRTQKPWGYFRLPQTIEAHEDPDLLFSFVGSPGGRTRDLLFQLRHPFGIVEEVHGFTFYNSSSTNFEERRLRYREIVERSRFVLCPRGAGTSTFRVYEALSAGRVPVIIADDWVPPDGPDWGRFSLRWPEGQIEGLIETLEERDSEWCGMSRAASAAYEEFFAFDVSFHRIVELCCELIQSGVTRSFPRHGTRNRAFVSAGILATRRRIPAPLWRVASRAVRDFGPRR